AARAACAAVEVAPAGGEPLARKIRDTMSRKFRGGPVGRDTSATAGAEEPETIEDVHEPFLIQCGLLARTPRGRVATELAYRHLGMEPPSAAVQQSLL